MSHARETIITAITARLAAQLPGVTIYAENQTVTTTNSLQVKFMGEEPGGETNQTQYHRVLNVMVAAIGGTIAERGSLAVGIELALLDVDFGAFDVQWSQVITERAEDEAADRLAPAVYDLQVEYFTTRGDPSTPIGRP